MLDIQRNLVKIMGSRIKDRNQITHGIVKIKIIPANPTFSVVSCLANDPCTITIRNIHMAHILLVLTIVIQNVNTYKDERMQLFYLR